MNNLDLIKMPKHIAFIIDGNGRWAKKRGMSRSLGHKAGLKALEAILKECFYEYNIKHVSVYAFSTENWNRPKEEIDYLFKILREYLGEDFVSKYPGIKLNIMGDYSKFPEDLCNCAKEVLEKTKHENKFVLNLGLNYSGKDEIVYAINRIIADRIDKVDKSTVDKYLYTAGQPEPDFIVRTSGEQRLSNFMLWQCAYSELYFPKVNWPSFNKKQLALALQEYQKRNRRFGEIKEEKGETNED